MTKVVACIAARMESSRLPGKVLMPLNDQPMNRWLCERLKRSKMIDEIVVCTPPSDANIPLQEAANSWGVSANNKTGKDILGGFITAGEEHDADVILRVTGDNLFTDPDYIDAMVRAHIDHDAEYSRVELLPLGITAEAMSMDMARHLHKNITDPEQTQYMVLYSFDPDTYKCCVVEPLERHKHPYYSCTIDTDDDWQRTEDILKDFPQLTWGPSLDEIIQWMDDNPERRKAVAPKTMLKMPYGETRSYQDFLDDFEVKKHKSIAVKAENYLKNGTIVSETTSAA